MKYIESTYEILALKALNRSTDKRWVEWAVDMIMAGFETEHLLILAGISEEPFNEFEIQALTTKVLNELKLDYSNLEQTIKNYISYLVTKSINGELDNLLVLRILKNICIELDYEKYLYDFYSLYFAKEDLIYSENQWYWDGANRDNIDEAIAEYFKKWLVENN